MIRNEKKFVCGYCSTPYATRPERDECEFNCYRKEIEKERVLKSAEKEKKFKEIENKVNEVKALIESYNKVYNEKLRFNVEIWTDYSGYCFSHVSESLDTNTLEKLIKEELTRTFSKFNKDINLKF